MRRQGLFAIALIAGMLFAALASGTAWAEKRVALVIGNSNYHDPGLNLSNPKNDAKDIARVLRSIGFETIEATDATKREFEHAMEQFALRASQADSVLFYYAGHAMQFQGRNYLMPVDARLENEFSIRYQMVPTDDIRDALDRASGVKIMILDACRNNPLADRLKVQLAGQRRSVGNVRGLARVDTTQGMVVAYATGADQVAMDGSGRNSPYTTALVKRMQEPGLEIGMMFRKVTQDVFEETHGRQRPATYTDLTTTFYLNQADRLAWDRIKDSTDPKVFNDFIAKFPSSPHALTAKTRRDMFGRFARERRETQALLAKLAEERRLLAEAAKQRRQDDEEAEAKAAQQAKEEEAKQREAKQREAQEREAKAAAERERQQREAALRREAEERQAAAERDRKAAEAARIREQEQQALLTAAERMRAEREAAKRREAEAKAAAEREAIAAAEREAKVAAARREAEAKAAAEREAKAAAERREAEAKAAAERERLEKEAALRREQEQQQAQLAAEAAERLAARPTTAQPKQEPATPTAIAVAALENPPVGESKLKHTPTDTPELIRAAQVELRRLGCFSGRDDGVLGERTRGAVKRYLAERGRSADDVAITGDFVSDLKSRRGRVCETHPVASHPASKPPRTRARRHPHTEDTASSRPAPRQAPAPSAPAPAPRRMMGIGF